MNAKTYSFAALRFIEDENIFDRVYWYLSPFALSLGQTVFAPVGPHDRIELARVERVETAAAQNAPYDMKLMKKIEAVTERKLFFAGVEAIEFGGLRYDSHRYTRFHKLCYVPTMPETLTLAEAYGLDTVVADVSDFAVVFRALIGGHGVLLVGGEGRSCCKTSLAFLRGSLEAEHALSSLGLSDREKTLLKEKLG